jgi:DNA-directed RNA polymerase subunit M/transcription elongation factor TFIIS
MSIRFACPVCKTAYTVDQSNAGKKAACPKCGQRVQVPAPVRAKTVLGEVLPLTPPPLPKRSNQDVPLTDSDGLLIDCHACGGPLSKQAETCPKCGEPSVWIHPECARFLKRLPRFRRHYPELVAEAKGSLLAIRSTRPKQFMDYAASAVGGVGLLVPFSLSGLAVALGASLGSAYASDALRKQAGPYTNLIMIDFRQSPPLWSSTNNQFWADVIDFFGLRRRRSAARLASR